MVLHRLREHKNPFLPDKNHFHHKLLRTGMRVRMVMVTILGIAVSFYRIERMAGMADEYNLPIGNKFDLMVVASFDD